MEDLFIFPLGLILFLQSDQVVAFTRLYDEDGKNEDGGECWKQIPERAR